MIWKNSKRIGPKIDSQIISFRAKESTREGAKTYDGICFYINLMLETFEFIFNLKTKISCRTESTCLKYSYQRRKLPLLLRRFYYLGFIFVSLIVEEKYSYD